MPNYSIDEEHRRAIELAGLSEAAVLAALRTHPRVFWPLTGEQAVIYALASQPPLVIALSDDGDDDWRVTNARPMDADEIARFTRILKGSDDD